MRLWQSLRSPLPPRARRVDFDDDGDIDVLVASSNKTTFHQNDGLESSAAPEEASPAGASPDARQLPFLGPS